MQTFISLIPFTGIAIMLVVAAIHIVANYRYDKQYKQRDKDFNARNNLLKLLSNLNMQSVTRPIRVWRPKRKPGARRI